MTKIDTKELRRHLIYLANKVINPFDCNRFRDLCNAYDEAQKEIKALEEVVKKFLALEFNGEDASCPSCHECACGGNSLEHKNECVFLEARKYVNFPLHFSGYHKQGTVFVCGFCNEKLIGEENINPNHNCLLIKDRAVL